MSTSKPTPLIGEKEKRLCPVCGRRSYSAGGIHPQCAMQQADAPRTKKLKEDKARQAKKAVKGTKRGQIPWNQKKCPQCGATVHVRKKICDCGYAVGGNA